MRYDSQSSKEYKQEHGPDQILGFDKPYDFLSNFYVDGLGYCLEVEYQACKATTQEDKEFVLDSLNAGSNYKISSRSKKKRKKNSSPSRLGRT